MLPGMFEAIFRDDFFVQGSLQSKVKYSISIWKG